MRKVALVLIAAAQAKIDAYVYDDGLSLAGEFTIDVRYKKR